MNSNDDQIKEFGKLVKAAIGSIAALEGKSESRVEQDIGDKIGKSASTVRKYKGEGLPPDWETIEILADFGVKKGYLNQRWLEKFLHASRYLHVFRYPNLKADEVLNRLYPKNPSIARSGLNPVDNLPAPPFIEYLPRRVPEQAVIEALAGRAALVMVVGSGGVGKTSLAYHISKQSISPDFPTENYQAVVWVDVVGRQWVLTLDMVLDTIARTLNYFPVAGETLQEKFWQIDKILRKQRVLIVLDSIDTLLDRINEKPVSEIISWLQSIPEPSKALVTCRRYFRYATNDLDWNSTIVVRLKEMSEDEAKVFVQQRCKPNSIATVFREEKYLSQFLKATGGNAKAIEVALGYLRHDGRAVEEVIDELLDGRGELFDMLFARSWDSQVRDHGRTVWMAMVVFPRSADPDALLKVSGLEKQDFDKSLSELTERALLDRVQQEDRTRITMHPLARAYARNHWEKRSLFQEESSERWLQWHLEFVEPIGSCWDDIQRLERLDFESDHIVSVMRWALDHHKYDEIYRLAEGTRYYYYVRGQLDRRLMVDKLHLDAARLESNRPEEIRALTYHILIAGRQNGDNLVSQYYTDLEGCAPIPDKLLGLYWQASAMYQMNEGNYQRSIELWSKTLHHHDMRMVVGAGHWIARCYLLLGNLEEARRTLETSLPIAKQKNYIRSILIHHLLLAHIATKQGCIDQAWNLLKAGSEQAGSLICPIERAEVTFVRGELYLAEGETLKAAEELRQAAHWFERMKMKELFDAESLLKTLDDV